MLWWGLCLVFVGWTACGVIWVPVDFGLLIACGRA